MSFEEIKQVEEERDRVLLEKLEEWRKDNLKIYKLLEEMNKKLDAVLA